MQDLIAFATHLADEAGAIIRPYFRQSMDIETKGDESPVTMADRAVEQRLRHLIEQNRPQDGIFGEEYGIKPSQNAYDWVIDPIDGTKSFIIGRPSFGTLIALCENGIPILGIIDQPILRERWVGAKETPTTFQGAKVQTRDCTDLRLARIASTAPAQLAPPSLPPFTGGRVLDPFTDERNFNASNSPPAGGGMKGGTLHLWQKLDSACAYTVWGGDCYSYGLLANGWLDGVVETLLAPYDYLALVPIVQGAGGWMGDWNGAPLTLLSNQNKNGQTLALGDVRLKDEILNLLSS